MSPLLWFVLIRLTAQGYLVGHLSKGDSLGILEDITYVHIKKEINNLPSCLQRIR